MSISTTPNDTYTGYAKLITSKAKELGVKVAVVFFDESLNVLGADSFGYSIISSRSVCKAKAIALKSKKHLSYVGSVGYVLKRLMSLLGGGLGVQGAVVLKDVGYVSVVSNKDTSKTVEVLDQGLRDCKIFQVGGEWEEKKDYVFPKPGWGTYSKV
ncbi:hypothetical protein TrVE_jg1252 [Triparma verrucosa]|uniref:Uncharacterized protein n=1 Tax=Triparma verrucosa TaxID=1606542 RepID=A0A9W7EXK6_9STRA|nr:hypothetical protein TrVE_jg1252 [Triparma verrucosa]